MAIDRVGLAAKLEAVMDSNGAALEGALGQLRPRGLLRGESTNRDALSFVCEWLARNFRNSEDNMKNFLEDIQEVTDSFINRLNSLQKDKEVEILDK